MFTKKTIFILFCFSSTLGYILPLNAQDKIAIKSGQEYDIKIISTKGPTIKYLLWEDKEGVVKEIKKKFVKWHRKEYLTKERVSISFSVGGVPFGTSTSLKNIMKNNGYEGRTKGLFSANYPISRGKVSWMLGVEFLTKPPHGICIDFAHTNRGYVQGISNSGVTPPLIGWPFINYAAGLTPEIHYSNPQLSLSYTYYFKSLKSNLQLGMLVNNTRIWESDKGKSYNESSKVKVGLLIGYAGSLMEKEKFYMRFQAQFRYVSPHKITISDSIIAGEKIALSHLFIGIQTGIKIFTNEN